MRKRLAQSRLTLPFAGSTVRQKSNGSLFMDYLATHSYVVLVRARSAWEQYKAASKEEKAKQWVGGAIPTEEDGSDAAVPWEKKEP